MMRMIAVAGLAAALVLTVNPALAAQAPAKDAHETSGAADGSDKKVCKRLENSGTRMKNERVCLTRAEWKKIDEMK